MMTAFLNKAEIGTKGYEIIGKPEYVAKNTEIKLFIIPYDENWHNKLINTAGAIRLEFIIQNE